MGEAREVVIGQLGARGDGVAVSGGETIYVPFALPGERWSIGGEASPERLSESSSRVAPICRHFGVCGGCSMQHLEQSAYLDWKRSLVVEAFARAGMPNKVAPIESVETASRRRAVLTSRRGLPEPSVGFHEARGHALVDLAECPVLDRRIVAALPGLRRLSALVCRDRSDLRIVVLATETGLDVNVTDGVAEIDAEARTQLAELAETHGWARLSVNDQDIVLRHRPGLDLHGVRVTLPPGAFVQAVSQAEAIMQALVVEAARGAKRVADLFAGVGTLTLPLARRARVLAVDNDGAALSALQEAVRAAQGLKPVETRQRNLFREPFSRKELEPFDCVVFDPPRAGAKAQAEMLAKSQVPVVVAVSCNPSTLARDLKYLIDGGYELERAVPIDQFVYSHHVEVVAALRRPKARGGRKRFRSGGLT